MLKRKLFSLWRKHLAIGSNPILSANALKRANIRYIGRAKLPAINRCAADCDLTVTGDQTSKCSEKQYKYEEKICGWQPTVTFGPIV